MCSLPDAQLQLRNGKGDDFPNTHSVRVSALRQIYSALDCPSECSVEGARKRGPQPGVLGELRGRHWYHGPVGQALEPWGKLRVY
jgi:hypothetical protein